MMDKNLEQENKELKEKRKTTTYWAFLILIIFGQNPPGDADGIVLFRKNRRIFRVEGNKGSAMIYFFNSFIKDDIKEISLKVI